MNAKKKNPLFVVTNQGKDVEQANSMFEALIKKLGLTKSIAQLEKWLGDFFQFLFSLVKNYAILVAVKNILDELVIKLENLLKSIYPQAYFYKA